MSKTYKTCYKFEDDYVRAGRLTHSEAHRMHFQRGSRRLFDFPRHKSTAEFDRNFKRDLDIDDEFDNDKDLNEDF